MLFSILFLALLSSHTHAATLTLATNNISPAESDLITHLLSDTPSNTVPTSNSSSAPNSSSISSSYMDIPIGPIECSSGPPRPFLRAEYLELLDEIMVRDDAMTVHSWRIGAGGGMGWFKGSCIIGVGTLNPSPVVGIFSPALVAHLAAKIVKNCSTDHGGRITFGAPTELTVLVGRRTMRSES